MFKRIPPLSHQQICLINIFWLLIYYFWFLFQKKLTSLAWTDWPRRSWGTHKLYFLNQKKKWSRNLEICSGFGIFLPQYFYDYIGIFLKLQNMFFSTKRSTLLLQYMLCNLVRSTWLNRMTPETFDSIHIYESNQRFWYIKDLRQSHLENLAHNHDSMKMGIRILNGFIWFYLQTLSTTISLSHFLKFASYFSEMTEICMKWPPSKSFLRPLFRDCFVW